MDDSPKKGLLSGLKSIIGKKEAPEYIEPELPPLPEDLPMAKDIQADIPAVDKLPPIPEMEETLAEEPLAPSLPEEPPETLESITGRVIDELPLPTQGHKEELPPLEIEDDLSVAPEPEDATPGDLPPLTTAKTLQEAANEELPPIPEWHEPKVTIPTPEDEEVPERIKEVLNKLTINEEMITKGRQELDKQIAEVDEKIKKIDAELAELMRI